VLRLERAVGELAAKANAEEVERGAHNASASSAAAAPQQARAADLKVELDQLDREIQLKSAEEQRLRATVHDYQQRVEHVPARESELAELTRDYSTLQTLYQTLLAKQEDSKIAANLERRQIGAQFKVLDPARVAERPFSPRRSRIDVIGIAAGLAIGLALVAIIEHRDRTLKTAADIRAELTLPVLAVVSLIESEQEQRRAAKRRFLVRFALGIVVSACLPVIVYSFLH
jgi:uncharacterized protein involved in exopolysaccharide biosynthesis